MLIVLEGADRTGKSSLVEELQLMIAGLGRKVVSIHRGVPEPGSHPLTDYALPISVYEPSACMHSLVCDRLHIGDFVYGPLYRDGPRQTAAQRAFTDSLIEARGGLKVHVTATAECVRARCEKAGEDYLKPEHISKVLTDFDRECDEDWSTVDTTEWSTKNDTRRVARRLIELARDAERQHLGIYNAAPDYTGPRRPRVLLVVDDPIDPTSLRGVSYGAAAPWEGTAGEYLHGALADAGVNTAAMVGIVGTDAPDLGALHAALGCPPVVALTSGPTRIEPLVAHRMVPPVKWLEAASAAPALAADSRKLYGIELARCVVFN